MKNILHIMDVHNNLTLHLVYNENDLLSTKTIDV